MGWNFSTVPQSYKYCDGGTTRAGISSSVAARLSCDKANVNTTPFINIATIKSIMHFVHHTATERVEYFWEKDLSIIARLGLLELSLSSSLSLSGSSDGMIEKSCFLFLEIYDSLMYDCSSCNAHFTITSEIRIRRMAHGKLGATRDTLVFFLHNSR